MIKIFNLFIWFLFCVSIALISASSPILALGAEGLHRDAPLEVTADKELEWNRADQTYIARGSAKAKQGANSIEGDVLKAYYSNENSADGRTNIYKIEAFGSVIITSDGNTALGDRAVYDLRSGEAVLTGRDLKLVTANETVSAQDRITFNSITNILTADGNAVITQGDDTLRSDRFVTYFVEQNGQRSLSRADALGNVVITTQNETLTGDQGEYIAATNIATVTGNVKIIRGENVLTGQKGEVNLTTRKSRLFGSATLSNTEDKTSDGDEPKERVRAIFYPE